MSLQKIEMHYFLSRVEVDGRTLLGINTHVPARGYSARELATAAQTPALVVDAAAGKVDEWPVETTRDVDGSLHLLGPWLPVRSAEETFRTGGREKWTYLAQIVRALSFFAGDWASSGPGGGTAGYGTAVSGMSVHLCEDGRVLLLPEAWMAQIGRYIADRDQQRFAARMSPPDAVGRQAAPSIEHFAGSVAYYLLTGRYPYSDTPPESERDFLQLERRKRRRFFQPLQLVVPGEDPALLSLVEDLLVAEKPEPELVGRAVEHFAARGSGVGDIGAAGQAGSSISADKLAKFWKRRVRRELFGDWVREHRAATVGGLAALALVLSIGTWAVGRATAWPASMGLPPEAVVLKFYRAVNDLDVATMEGLVTRGAADRLRTAVTYMYVSSRSRLVYEVGDPHLRPDAWLAAGRPALDPGTFLYGVAGLKLVESTKVDGAGVEITVTYDYYTPGSANVPEGVENPHPEYWAQPVRETVLLVFERGAWLIADLLPG